MLAPRRTGFTLVEMLVSMVILIMIMVIIFETTGMVSNVWKTTSSKTSAFAGARAGFESMTRNLSQTTLNTYYDYYDSARKSSLDPSYSGEPSIYGRTSELQLIAGKNLLPGNQIMHAIFFQAPLGTGSNAAYTGMENLLATCGYWIGFNKEIRPPFFAAAGLPAPPSRFRLMQYQEATEKLSIYTNPSGTGWITQPTATDQLPSRPLADNILALIIIPRKSQDLPDQTSLAPDYEYNTRTTWSSGQQPATMNQLPPVIHVVMVAADEVSMGRLLESTTDATTASAALGLDYTELFQSADKLEDDLTAMSTSLANKGVKFRIFRTDVAMRGSKWSN